MLVWSDLQVAPEIWCILSSFRHVRRSSSRMLVVNNLIAGRTVMFLVMLRSFLATLSILSCVEIYATPSSCLAPRKERTTKERAMHAIVGKPGVSTALQLWIVRRALHMVSPVLTLLRCASNT